MSRTDSATGVTTYKLQEACAAAAVLLDGGTIGWEPGDGTHYELTLVEVARRRYLLGTTIEFLAAWPESRTNPQTWVPRLPRGSWPGLRPLLAAAQMVWGDDLALNRDRDAREEASIRFGNMQYERIRSDELQLRDDAKIGAAVRYLLTEQGHDMLSPDVAERVPDGG